MKQLLFIFCILLTVNALAQSSAQSERNLQPSVMVIPFAKEGQDMRRVLEHDLNLRVAVTKVKEGFDSRGFSTIDFRGKVRQLSNEKAMEIGNQSSIKQEIIELSGADIYVETESQVIRTDLGNSVTVIVTAYDAFSGQSLANKVASSPKFYTENFEKLTEKAVDALIEDFLSTMQLKFDEMNENGRVLVVNIGFSENSAWDMDSDFGNTGDLLSDALENWMEANAYKGYYHLQGVTATKMIFDEVRVPLRDEKGRHFRPSKFAAQLRKYLIAQGLEATRDVQGTKIFITIQ